ncbi:GNAT family N-acetyltransferase [Geomicrobium sp. JCM 19039]|uniref:GNAT family N-acetyltransferase n=1 Tax=Geomicrobium sp. JCM 19039 TaxID=1460636 RepID=UPI001EE640A0|nr:GNAT family N-acetyltransferase [Geomicrobium sp. JCM 19039]
MISIQDHLEICRFDKSDIQGLIDLSESVGWDYDRSEIVTVLESGAIYGHKNVTGTIVSSAAIITYNSYIASIGMVIVNPSYRGIGLAKEVTKRCMDSTAQHTKVMLISTDEGKPLYER